MGADTESIFSSIKPGTHVRRTKAKAPVFLTALSRETPIDLMFSIHLMTADKFPEKPGDGASKTELKAYASACNRLYEDEATCPTIGTMWFQKKDHSLNLVCFNIGKTHRGQGYGAHALLTALSKLKTLEGFDTFNLSVQRYQLFCSSRPNPDYERLVGFYERVGFARTASRAAENQCDLALPRLMFNPHQYSIKNAR